MTLDTLRAQVSGLELAAVLLLVAYLVLAMRQNAWCWPAGFLSSVLSIVLFADARLFMESGLQVFYAAMACYGAWQWLRGGVGGTGVVIHTWSLARHLGVIAGILCVSAGFALALRHTSQVMPMLDSLTTVGAIVTTWMVARKVLENWIYWFVIDGVSIWLYVDRGLFLYAGLYVLFLVLVVVGYRRWRTDWQRNQLAAPAGA